MNFPSFILVIVGAICFVLVAYFSFKDFDKKQLLLFGYFCLPVIVALYGGNISYPVHPGKIYLLYVLISNVLVFDSDRTKLFLAKYGAWLGLFFFLLLALNAMSYLFINTSLRLLVTSCTYFSSLFFITLFTFNAPITIKDVDKILPKYFLFILLPIFFVCLLEALGNRELVAFFAGPEYENYSFERAGFYRINGIFHWPNPFANYLSCLFLVYMWRGSRSKIFFLCGNIIFLFIILSITRANIVACAIITILIMIKRYDNYKKYLMVIMLFLLGFFAHDSTKSVMSETADQYIHNMSWRSYYILRGVDIASDNFPLGEGIYATGSLLGHSDNINFKNKYNLEFQDLKTTDSFLAAALIEFGIVGTLVLVAMFFWLYIKDNTHLVKYYILLFLLIAYSDADILSMASAESIFFFLFVGVNFNTYEGL